jgi:hypothetical protein
MIFLATSWKLILEPPRESSGAGERTVRGRGQKREARDADGAVRGEEREAREGSPGVERER